MFFGAETALAQDGWFFETKLYYTHTGLELIIICLSQRWACVSMLCWLGFYQANVNTVQSVTFCIAVELSRYIS